MMDFFTTSRLFASKFIFFTSYEQCWKKNVSNDIVEFRNFDILILIMSKCVNICPYFEQVPMGSMKSK